MGDFNVAAALVGGLGQCTSAQMLHQQQQANYNYQMQFAQQLQYGQTQPYFAPEAPPAAATRPGDDAIAWLKTRVWEVCKAWQ